MKFKKLASNAIDFTINRAIEIMGVTFLVTGLFLLTSLITFSPDDPNFIFPNNIKIKNILGFRGSFTADILFQSLGVIVLLVIRSLIWVRWKTQRHYSFG